MEFELTCWSLAVYKWISNISLVADTIGNMVPHITIGITPTYSWTRVDTLLLPAGSIRGTIWVEDAFGLTVRRGSSHAGQAGAVTAVSVPPRRIAVGSTGVGITWILWDNWCNN